MVDINTEIEKQISLVEAGEILDAVIIEKDTKNILVVPISIGKGTPNMFHVCDTVDDLRGLLNPENDKDFFVVEFKGAAADFNSYRRLFYHSEGWTLRLEGYMLGGHWEYTAISPTSSSYDACKEWKTTVKDVLYDAISELSAEAPGLPQDGWTKE